MNCPTCNRSMPQGFPLRSVIDQEIRHVCGPCIDHNAEPAGIVEAMGGGIVLLPFDLAQAIHIHDGREYLTLGEWQDQSRKPAPNLEPVVEPEPKTERVEDEGDDDLLRLMNLSKRVAEPLKDNGRMFALPPTVWAS